MSVAQSLQSRRTTSVPLGSRVLGQSDVRPLSSTRHQCTPPSTAVHNPPSGQFGLDVVTSQVRTAVNDWIGVDVWLVPITVPHTTGNARTTDGLGAHVLIRLPAARQLHHRLPTTTTITTTTTTIVYVYYLINRYFRFDDFSLRSLDLTAEECLPEFGNPIIRSDQVTTVIIIIINIGDCFISAVLRRRSGQMARSDDPYKEGYLYFPPHGVLSQLKVIDQFYYFYNNNNTTNRWFLINVHNA